MADRVGEHDLLGRVLALKSTAMLAEVASEDLAGLARAAQAHDTAAGAALPETTAAGPVVHFLVEGRVQALHEGAPARRIEAPAVVGLLEGLEGAATPRLVAEGPVRSLGLGAADLADVLSDDFELWSAVFRDVNRTLLAAARARGLVVPATAAPPGSGEEDLSEHSGRMALLHRSAPFHRVRIHTLGQLALEMEPVRLPAGRVLWEEGAAAGSFVAVGAGTLRCTSAQDSARVDLRAGALLGLAEACADELLAYRAETTEPTLLMRLSKEAFIDVMEDDAEMALEVLQVLARAGAELSARPGRAS